MGAASGRTAGVRSRAYRVQLPRPRRSGCRGPRLRRDLRGRPFAAGTRLRDQRQRGLFRRQAGHLRRHGTCWAAHSGRFPGFDAASRAGYVDVTSIDCAPGQKKARVSFAHDRNIVDYDQLFAATTMMPSHVIADELGVRSSVTTALLGTTGRSGASRSCGTPPGISNPASSGDRSASRRRGHTSSNPFWTAARWCSSRMTAGGAPKPMTKRVNVWPQKADIQDRINDRAPTSSTSRPARRER